MYDAEWEAAYEEIWTSRDHAHLEKKYGLNIHDLQALATVKSLNRWTHTETVVNDLKTCQKELLRALEVIQQFRYRN